VALEQGRCRPPHKFLGGHPYVLSSVAALRQKVHRKSTPRPRCRDLSQFSNFIQIVKLTCPFDGNSEQRHCEKMLKYENLRAGCAITAKKEICLMCIEVGARGELLPHCSLLTSRIGKPAARELRSEMLKFATSTSKTIPKHPLVLASNDFCHF